MKSKLLEANLRLVISTAKHATDRGLQFLDLIQVRNDGLKKAIDTDDYRHHGKLLTYAAEFIQHEIHRSTANRARTILRGRTQAEGGLESTMARLAASAAA